jgi:hypothetical protein
MKQYLIISPHTAEDCIRALQDALAIGYLTHFNWGCKDGEHTGWAFIEADSKAEALMAVPTSQRKSAKAVELTAFSPEQVKKLH